MGAVARAETCGHAGVNPLRQQALLGQLRAPAVRAKVIAEAEASLATLLDQEQEEPWFCNDCEHPSRECECTPHGWDD